MKQVINNIYLKCVKFNLLEELSCFVREQKVENTLFLDDKNGNDYYCYIAYHSLTSEKLFLISFCSDEEEDNLNLLFWNEYKIIVLYTGNDTYLIDDKLNVVSMFRNITPLVGLYLLNTNRLLILEEISLKIINARGEILKSEDFDFIEDFVIKDYQLTICTDQGEIKYNL